MKKLLITAALGFLLVSGQALAAELTVSAAASLTDAFTELKQLFETANPGMTVHTNFAASNPLLKQIQEGAPVDVFASADQETMDKAAASKSIDPATRVNFAENSLVLIVPSTAKFIPADPSQLQDSKVAHIAVGNVDSVPAGRYTKNALTKLSLWDVLTPKYVFAESVRQVLDYVSRGEADAGMVYATDAYKAKNTVKIVGTLKTDKAVIYPISIINGAKNADAAKKFLAFVMSDEGQKVLAKYGFKKPQA